MGQLDNFGDFNSFISDSMVLTDDNKSKAVTVTANETNQSSNNGCEYSSSSSCSYKFQLPERVIFDSLKSELEGGNLSMKWEVDEEEDKNEENNKKQTVPIEIVEE